MPDLKIETWPTDYNLAYKLSEIKVKINKKLKKLVTTFQVNKASNYLELLSFQY